MIKLLISITATDETRAVLEGAADIVDVKNPAEGALGAASTEVLSEVRRLLPADCPTSAALGETGVADVTQYTLSLAGRDHDQAAAQRGKAQYDTLCVACHGLAGEGNPMLGAPNLTNDLWLYGGSEEDIAFAIRNGRNGNMPSFADVLDDPEQPFDAPCRKGGKAD